MCLAAGVYDVTVGLTVEQARSLRIRGPGAGDRARRTRHGAHDQELGRGGGREARDRQRRRRAGGGARPERRAREPARPRRPLVRQGGHAAPGSSSPAPPRSSRCAGTSSSRERRSTRAQATGSGSSRPGCASRRTSSFGLDRGIDLGGAAAYLYACRVSGNEVLAGRAGGIVATGAVAPRGSLDVLGNKIATDGPGIVVGTDATVDGNTVNRLGREGGSDGIVVAAGPIPVPPSDVRITGNRVYDRTDNGIVLLTSARNLVVKHNVLTGAMRNGIVVSDKAAAERAVVENNQVRLEGEGFGTGIAIGRVTSAAVVANTISTRRRPGRPRGRDLGARVRERPRSRGTSSTGSPRSRSPRSRRGSRSSAPSSAPGSPTTSSASAPRAPCPADAAGLALEMQTFEREPARPGQQAVRRPDQRPSALHRPRVGFRGARRAKATPRSARTRSPAGGASVTCLVRVGGDVVAEGNQCAHALDTEPVGMYLRGSSITASTNRVRGTRAMLVLDVAENRFAALGNLAAGGTHLGSPGAGLPSPWDPSTRSCRDAGR